jgi:hypothetical protein
VACRFARSAEKLSLQKKYVKYILPILAIFLFTACKNSGGTDVPYDLPPQAPAPPEKFCYAQIGIDSANTTMELTIAGDSIFGTLDYLKWEKQRSGNFSGVIYGTTLLVTYKFKGDSSAQSVREEWKMVDDSLFEKTKRPMYEVTVGDRTTLVNPDVLQSTLFKVPCK